MNGWQKREFYEAVKNFKNLGKQSNSNKGKTYYNCGIKGHNKGEFKFWKKQKQEDSSNVQNSNNTNIIEHETKLVAMVSKLNIGMITELYMAASTMSNDWWYDSGSIIHI